MWLADMLDGNAWTHPRVIGPSRPLCGTLDHFHSRSRFFWPTGSLMRNRSHSKELSDLPGRNGEARQTKPLKNSRR
jgi:hypothetical protein